MDNLDFTSIFRDLKTLFGGNGDKTEGATLSQPETKESFPQSAPSLRDREKEERVEQFFLRHLCLSGKDESPPLPLGTVIQPKREDISPEKPPRKKQEIFIGNLPLFPPENQP